MTTQHEEWTDKLSDFLDDELSADERRAVESHLAECAACTLVLEDLKQVVSRARMLDPRPPQADLWPGVAERIDTERAPATVVPMRTRNGWRVTFTLPQLAAASVLIALMSGALAWSLRSRVALVEERSAEASRSTAPVQTPPVASPDPSALEREASAERSVVPVSLADAQYDAAVSD